MSNNTSRKKGLSPIQAIRAFCMQCEGGSSAHVQSCRYPPCPFYAYRIGKVKKAKPTDTLTAIKRYCFEQCQAGSSQHEVVICQGDKATLGSCPVFSFRLGKNPNKLKLLSDERRIALVEAGKQYRFHTGCNPSFSTPESSEMDRAIVDLGSHENNTMRIRQSISCGGKEI